MVRLNWDLWPLLAEGVDVVLLAALQRLLFFCFCFCCFVFVLGMHKWSIDIFMEGFLGIVLWRGWFSGVMWLW